MMLLLSTGTVLYLLIINACFINPPLSQIIGIIFLCVQSKRNTFSCFHVTHIKASVMQICSFVLFTGGLDLSSSAPAPVAVQNNSFLVNTNQSSNFLVDDLLNCEPVMNSKLKRSFFKKYIHLLGNEY